MMHQDFLHNALNHHPTPRAQPSSFWSISKCPKFQPNPYFPSEDRITILASMHPMFQVSIVGYDHSSPNFVWKIHVHIQLCLPSRSCTLCRVEVAKVIEIQSAKIRVQLSFYLQITATVSGDMPFWRSLHLEEWKYCRAQFYEVPQKQNKNFFDNQNDI